MTAITDIFKPPSMTKQPPPYFYNALKPPCRPPLSCFHHAFLIESMFSCRDIPGKRKRQKSHKTVCRTLKTCKRVFRIMPLKSSCNPLVWRLFHHGIKNVLVIWSVYPIFDRWSGLTVGQPLTAGQFFLVNQFACQGTLRPSRNRKDRNNAFCAFCESLSAPKKKRDY